MPIQNAGIAAMFDQTADLLEGCEPISGARLPAIQIAHRHGIGHPPPYAGPARPAPLKRLGLFCVKLLELEQVEEPTSLQCRAVVSFSNEFGGELARYFQGRS